MIDDFSPTTDWPPRFGGEIDTARLHWFTHPQLRATQVAVDPTSVTVLATYVPTAPDSAPGRAATRQSSGVTAAGAHRPQWVPAATGQLQGAAASQLVSAAHELAESQAFDPPLLAKYTVKLKCRRYLLVKFTDWNE